MSDTNSKPKPKRLPKGQRTHIRRMKQTAGKEASISNPQSSPVQPARVHKKHEKA